MLFLSLAATALAAGPHEDVDYDCVDTEFVSGAGQVVFPVDCDDESVIEDLPLVAFLAGAGYSDAAYLDLAKHLAGNGYVTLQANVSGSVKDRSADGLAALSALSAWSGYADLSGDLVTAGHGRGGEAAVLMSKSVPSSWDVRSIVALAPTDDLRLHTTARFASSLLVVTGLEDQDVRGNRVDRSLFCGPPCVSPSASMRTGFALWDRSGGPASPFGGSADAVTRAHVTLDDGGHYLGPALSDQTSAHFVLWLDWQLGGVDHEDVFHGGTTLTGVDTSAIRLQYKAPGALVVEDFERSSWSGVASGGVLSPITATSRAAYKHIGTGDDYVFTSPHDTGVLAVTWPSGMTARVVRVGLPSATDVSAYDSLSFRIAQVFDSDHAPSGDLEIEVQLITNGTGPGTVTTVDLSDYADVRPAPDVDLPLGLGGLAGNYSKTPMQTVRIPLADFDGVDLGSVRNVLFRLPASGGEIHLDDVRFTP